MPRGGVTAHEVRARPPVGVLCGLCGAPAGRVSRFLWGVFIIAVHRAFCMLGSGARHIAVYCGELCQTSERGYFRRS